MAYTSEQRAANLAKAREKALELKRANTNVKLERKPHIDDDLSGTLSRVVARLRSIADNGFNLQCPRCQKEFGGGDTIRDLSSLLNIAYDKLYKNEPVNVKASFNYNNFMDIDLSPEESPKKIIDAEVKVEGTVDSP